MRHALLRFIACAAIAWLALVPDAVSAASYTLGPQDKVRIKVVEWRRSIGEFFEWTPLVGEFTIGGTGEISLPLVGEIKVTGLRTDELATEIAKRLRERVGLVDLPAASVEVSQFRPFYILGLVDKPGEFPFRPGMNVLQAVGVAGGLYRPTEAGLVRMQRDAITAGGDYRVRELEVRKNRAKEIRLQAELDEKSAFEFPSVLKNDRAYADLLAGEQQTFTNRRNTLAAQVEGAQRLVDLFRAETVALSGKSKSLVRQLELINKERMAVTDLVQKGLAVAPRQYLLERTVAEIESKQLDIDTAALRAKQEMTKAERSIIDFRNDRRQDILDELQDVRAKRGEAETKSATARTLVHEAEVIAPRLLADRIRGQRIDPIYTLLRQTPDGQQEMSVSENTPIEPGDVIKIDTADPDASDDKAASDTPSTRQARGNGPVNN